MSLKGESGGVAPQTFQAHEGTKQGCADPSGLFGTATTMSQGFSSALQQMRTLKKPSDESAVIDAIMCVDPTFPNDQALQRIDSFKKEWKHMLEEKKEDHFGCGYDHESTTDANRDYIYTVSSNKKDWFAGDHSTEQMTAQTLGQKTSPLRGPNTRKARKGANFPSPMARIRGRSFEKPRMRDKGASTGNPVRKTPEEVKAEKQRKWKTKMRLDQEKRIEERIARDGDSDLKKEIRVNGRKIAKLIGEKVLHMIDHQCGAIDDVVASDSDDSMFDDSMNEEEPSHGYVSSHSSPRVKPMQRGRSRRRRHEKIGRKNKGTKRSVKVNPSERAEDSDWTLTSQSREDSPKQDTGLPVLGSTRTTGLEGKDGIKGDAVRSRILNSTAEAQLLLRTDENLTHPRLPQKTKSVDHQMSTGPASSLSASACLDAKDSNYAKAFVNNLVHIGVSFFWQKEVMTMNPASIVLRMKPGHLTLEGTYCGPRLVWQESAYETYGINLFDIQTLERATPVQLKEYPFSMPSRTVYLRMKNDQEFVFEAPSENAASRFVHGMKWLVARLTFNLVIGNMDVFFELLEARASNTYSTNRDGIALVDASRRAAVMDDMTEQVLERSVLPGQEF